MDGTTSRWAALLGRIRDSMTSTGTDASRLFQRLDADRDGFLGLPDLANLFRAFQPDCPSTVLAEAFRHFGLDQKTCIDEEDFCTRLEANGIERLEEAGWTQCFSWMPGPEARCLVPSEAEGLLKLLGSNVSNLPAECNDLEFLIPGDPEAVWAKQLYMAYYEKHNAAIERLMHKTQAKSSEAFYFSLFADQYEVMSSEFYVWRIRCPGLLGRFQETAEMGSGPSKRLRTMLAWHGASGDLEQKALQAGELRPAGQMLVGDQPWLLASRPLQSFGKGPEWTIFYLCLVNLKDSEMTRSITREPGRVLPLYCLVHPSIWHSWPCGDWP